MARSEETKKAVERAYGSGIIYDHSRWFKEADDLSIVKRKRFCSQCGELLSEGYDPTERDVAVHQYNKLIEAGMTWTVSPAGEE